MRSAEGETQQVLEVKMVRELEICKKGLDTNLFMMVFDVVHSYDLPTWIRLGQWRLSAGPMKLPLCNNTNVHNNSLRWKYPVPTVDSHFGVIA